VLWALLILYTFKVLAAVCDGHLTSVLELIVEKLRIPEDVAGATFLAMSSSAPELFCSIVATFVLVSPSGVGNIVGSALFNLLCIIGVLPLVSKTGPLKIWWYPTIRDALFYALAIVELFWVIHDKKVETWEAAVMTVSYLIYVAYFFLNQRIMDRFGLTPPVSTLPEDDSKDSKVMISANPASNSETVKAQSGDKGSTIVDSDVAIDAEMIGAGMNGDLMEEDLTIPEEGGAALPKGVQVCIFRTNEKIGDDLQPVLATPNPAMPPISNAAAKLGQGCPEAPSSAGPDLLTNGDSREPLTNGHKHDALANKSKPETADGAAGKGETANGQGSETSDEDPPGLCTRLDPFIRLIDLSMPGYNWTALAFTIVVLWVAFFTYVMVDAAHRFGCFVKVPEIPMGLIVLAAGTSVPDMIASMSVARQGCADMAAANAVGSNTFDILFGLGVPWLLRGKPVEVPVDELRESIFILAGALVAYVLVLHLNGWLLDRKIGIFMLTVYSASLIFILIRHYTHFADEH